MKVDAGLLATRVRYDSQHIRTPETENSKIALSTMNYSFFQKGREKASDLPSGSQACRAEPEKQAVRRSVA